MRFEVRSLGEAQYVIHDGFYNKDLPAQYANAANAEKYAEKLNKTRPQVPFVPKKKGS
jgi:hypothetical protein